VNGGLTVWEQKTMLVSNDDPVSGTLPDRRGRSSRSLTDSGDRGHPGALIFPFAEDRQRQPAAIITKGTKTRSKKVCVFFARAVILSFYTLFQWVAICIRRNVLSEERAYGSLTVGDERT
jgi:hypothetical protein